MKPLRFVILILFILTKTAWGGEKTVWLDELDIALIDQGWGRAIAGKSVEGKPMFLGGKHFERGVGSHAPGALYVSLDGNTRRFQALLGINDSVGHRGSASVNIYGDGTELFSSGIFRGGDPPISVDIDVTGIRLLTMVMNHGGDNMDFDHVNWAEARFLAAGDDPKLLLHPQEDAVILTPPPPDAPRINGPAIFGVRPGSPFLYRIPTTGKRPIAFNARRLPKGLMLDKETGIITGIIQDKAKRIHPVTLVAKNTYGTAKREFRIVVGDTLALTPPMGWNHWYAHYDRITDTMVREAADIMVSSGMADVGYQYVNIDDCWMNAPKNNDPLRVGPLRDANGVIIPNRHFPDMRALVDYIHAKGLRAGIYTSPGPLTCAGYAGSHGHEETDARTFAAWGFDFLKYDWCSYTEVAPDNTLNSLKKPFAEMSALLRLQSRDIVFNLCQYGMGEVWKWGREVGGNCWRTAGDLGFELRRYHDVALRNAALHSYARSGAWNDPDYLQIGFVGDARTTGNPQPCPLTPNEQYSYMSLWCLMAAPLFYSGDMTRLDAFTLNVLCNPEVIEINQDQLGKQGYPVLREEGWEIWTKPLADGSTAVGLFNRSEFSREITFHKKEAGIEGSFRLRDLWRQQDLGVFDESFTVVVPRHGVCLLRAYPLGNCCS